MKFWKMLVSLLGGCRGYTIFSWRCSSYWDVGSRGVCIGIRLCKRWWPGDTLSSRWFENSSGKWSGITRRPGVVRVLHSKAPQSENHGGLLCNSSRRPPMINASPAKIQVFVAASPPSCKSLEVALRNTRRISCPVSLRSCLLDECEDIILYVDGEGCGWEGGDQLMRKAEHGITARYQNIHGGSLSGCI